MYPYETKESIINSINKELNCEIRKHNKEKVSKYKSCLWLQKSTGKFIYNDTFINDKVGAELVIDGNLVCKGERKHQGEKMIKYSVR